MGVQRQQTLDRISDHQQAAGVASQTQGPATGIGQDFGGLAVKARADHPAVMQAGDQRIVFQQQCFGAIDVRSANRLHALEALIVGIGAAGERWRGGWRPGHGFDPGGHQQQEASNDNDHQQQAMAKPERATHARTSDRARCFSAISRSASIEAADSRSIRRLSNNRLARRIATPLN